MRIAKMSSLPMRIVLGLVPLALAVVFAAPFISCSTGDAPTPPTGMPGTDEILYDTPRPGITVWADPSTVTVPNPITGGNSITEVIARYLDPDGQPEEGRQMNFMAEPVSGHVVFNPPAGITDENGYASTEATIDSGTPEGSLNIVAYTSPASGGPNVKGQTRIMVKVIVIPLEIVTGPVLPGGQETVAYPSQQLLARGGTGSYLWSVIGGGLPLGVVLSSDGVISGTPAAGQAGFSPFSVTIQVSDGVTTASKTFSMTVAVAPVAP